MSKNNIITIIIGIAIIASGAFYGGIKYDQNHTNANRAQFGQGLRGAGRGMAGGIRGGFTVGEIISKDATSLTVKLASGGSRIIFLTDKTPVGKSVQGSTADLTPGQQVMVTGSTSSDGSVTAESIQIRPTQEQK